MAALKPPMVRVLDPDVQHVSDAWFRTRAKIAPRFWILDDNNYQQHAALRADPIDFANTNAAQQIAAVQRMEQQARERGLPFPPREMTYLNAVNEFPIWGDDQATVRSALNAYSMVFGAKVEAAGYSALLGCINVGHPSDDTWDWYAGTLAWLEQSARSALELHEYWQPEGPNARWVDPGGNERADATWLAWRHKRLKRSVRIVIGECGVDGVIHGRHADRNMGWRAYMDAKTYATQLKEYVAGCDKRVIACLPFLTDYRENENNAWSTFDTEPAHPEILARAPYEVEPGETYLPIVSGPSGRDKPVHPCPGFIISQHFYQNPQNYERFGLIGHNGTDIATPVGTPVVAPLDAVVAWVGDDVNYGRYVRLYSSAVKVHFFFAHLSNVTVAAGAAVKAGHVVAQTGNTGNSTGPHVHVEVRLGEESKYSSETPMPKGRVDPETWFAVLGTRL